MSVWYPTASPEKDLVLGLHQLHIARDQPPVAGTFPLVLFSHGSRGSDLDHHNWGENLARQGYLVAAPRHMADSVLASDGEKLLSRLQDLEFTLETLGKHPILAPHLAPGPVAALGFSYGATTLLTLLGAELSPPLPSCPTGELARRGLAAAVLLAPYAALFDPKSLAKVKAPLLVFQAASDSQTPNPTNSRVVLDLVSSPHQEMEVPGSHFVFMAPAVPAARGKYPRYYQDAPGLDREEIHARLAREISAFFGRVYPLPPLL
ncbi:MAG: hypothetical protein LBU79_09360 [Planctomycetota bacterium]|nr:hypothetical protein [Planctomycetota bacterium]